MSDDVVAASTDSPAIHDLGAALLTPGLFVIVFDVPGVEPLVTDCTLAVLLVKYLLLLRRAEAPLRVPPCFLFIPKWIIDSEHLIMPSLLMDCIIIDLNSETIKLSMLIRTSLSYRILASLF